MKSDLRFKQKGKRVGSAGGFYNQLMSHNSSVPVVGEGATLLLHSDRHAYEVLAADENKKTAILQRYHPKRTDNLGMSDSQAYEYKEFQGQPFTVYYKWGGWKTRNEMVTFTKEAREKYGDFGKEIHEAYKNAGGKYDGRNAFISTVIPSLTKKIVQWSPFAIIFGVKEEYYDFSF